MSGNGLGVIFDVDGVLVNSYRAHLKSWEKPGRKFGVEMTEANFVRTFGKTNPEIIKLLWPGKFDEAQSIALADEKEAAYREVLKNNFPEMEGASDLIKSLHDAGFALAIGSS